MFLPFFHKYPYTNFEQLNLDWLMEHVGAFDDRLNQVEATVTDLNTRVDTVESDVSALQERMTDAEGDILSIGGRVTTNENDISDLKERMTDAESDIADIKPRITTAEHNITSLESTINGIRSDLNALDTEVDAIPIVSANPGGSGSTLNTIGIGGTVYSIPSGGGGGGGSSVTPNPSGTPTDDLNSVDIDGTIYAIAGGGTTVVANPGGVDNPDLTSVSIGGTAYDIPVTDLTQVNRAISQLGSQLDDAASDIDALEASTGFLSTDIVAATLNASKVVSASTTGEIASDDNVTLGPGTWLIEAYAITTGNNNTNSGLKMYNRISGLSNMVDRCYTEGYSYESNVTSVYNTISVITKLTTNTSIGIVSTIKEKTGSITSITLNSYVRAIRIR